MTSRRNETLAPQRGHRSANGDICAVRSSQRIVFAEADETQYEPGLGGYRSLART